ncbi:hypothetical protein QQY24_02935 [Streptomyces sp. TG1A-8]|nr:hypothetical protein [Streptomyces sp. TG1A-8]MDO0924420.1 hypothetical protein [Streptomyces sp. TG1A-8]
MGALAVALGVREAGLVFTACAAPLVAAVGAGVGRRPVTPRRPHPLT